jgi:hypothetical protein
MDADPAIQQMTITGGIGTLTMHADGREDWQPAQPNTPAAPSRPRPAPEDMAAARRAVCSACESLRDGRCTAAGCGCAGEAKPETWSSRCPLGRWSTC